MSITAFFFFSRKMLDVDRIAVSFRNFSVVSCFPTQFFFYIVFIIKPQLVIYRFISFPAFSLFVGRGMVEKILFDRLLRHTKHGFFMCLFCSETEAFFTPWRLFQTLDCIKLKPFLPIIKGVFMRDLNILTVNWTHNFVL